MKIQLKQNEDQSYDLYVNDELKDNYSTIESAVKEAERIREESDD